MGWEFRVRVSNLKFRVSDSGIRDFGSRFSGFGPGYLTGGFTLSGVKSRLKIA